MCAIDIQMMNCLLFSALSMPYIKVLMGPMEQFLASSAYRGAPKCRMWWGGQIIALRFPGNSVA